MARRNRRLYKAHWVSTEVSRLMEMPSNSARYFDPESGVEMTVRVSVKEVITNDGRFYSTAVRQKDWRYPQGRMW